MPGRPAVVVYHIGSLGDTIVTIPALRAVRRHYSSSRVVMFHNSYRRGGGAVSVRAVLSGTGLVDDFVSYDADVGGVGRMGVISGAILRLRAVGPDVAVNLAPSERPERAVRRDRAFFRLCGARHLVGFHAISRADLYPRDPDGHPAAVPHEARRKLDRLAQDGLATGGDDRILLPPFFDPPAAARAAAGRFLAERRKKTAARLVAVCPSANMPAKAWPLDRFVDLGRRLAAEGAELLIVGGPSDREVGERLRAGWGEGLNSAGEFDLAGSAALLARCDVHVGVDSGSSHLAAAVGARCVVICSDRLHPGQWDPLGPGHLVVRQRVPCGGCNLPECPEPGHPCMLGIGVDEVWRAMQGAGLP